MFLRVKLWWERLGLPANERVPAAIRHKQLVRRVRSNDPIAFPSVSAETGTPVGPEIKVGHPTFHDMAEHAIAATMTELVLRSNLRVNAFRIVGFERVDQYSGIHTIQPVWAEIQYHALDDDRMARCGFTEGHTWEWPDGHFPARRDTSVNCPGCLERLSEEKVAA